MTVRCSEWRSSCHSQCEPQHCPSKYWCLIRFYRSSGSKPEGHLLKRLLWFWWHLRGRGGSWCSHRGRAMLLWEVYCRAEPVRGHRWGLGCLRIAFENDYCPPNPQSHLLKPGQSKSELWWMICLNIYRSITFLNNLLKSGMSHLLGYLRWI